MKFFNTLTKQIEEFVPRDKNNVTMYTCGPTVYHFAHIGNLRTYIMEDVLERVLNFVGYKVNRVMNITDIGHLTGDSDDGEDKMLQGAQREHKTVMEIAKEYTDAFKYDCKRLNILLPKTVVPATSCVEKYIEIIEKLLKDGYAYISNSNVYFDVSKLKEYYVLTNHNIDDMIVGAREGVNADDGKRNQADFVLWFTKSKFADQELKWNSPWGYGYPGWHIECSGISNKYLGDYLDIHCGGVDNKFPHHTNEIAQSESYLGHKWCNYWFHSEHLNDERGKMSKSSGEFLTVDNLVKHGYDPLAYRFFCLMSHYSKPLVFSYDRLDGAVSSFNKILDKTTKLAQYKNDNFVINDQYSGYYNKFREAVENNLNTSMAITVLIDLLKSEADNVTKYNLVKKFDEVLGLDLLKAREIDDIPSYIHELAEKRWQAKQDKNWAEADVLRNQITQLGYTILDSKDGFEIKKI